MNNERNPLLMNNPLRIVIFPILLVGIGYGLWEFQHSLIGDPPTEHFTPPQQGMQGHGDMTTSYRDPDIERLRKATEIRPKSRETWMALVEKLREKANEGVILRQQAALEIIDALSRVLEIDENDTEAILMIADISFEQQALEKALTFYERYLALQPEDDKTRARYASTLTFLGRADEAKAELEEILKRNPESFQANAFLALAYAQMGDTEAMQNQGAKAIALAPNEEAKQRITQFLEGFGRSAEERASQADASSVSKPTGGSAVQLGQFLSQNPCRRPENTGLQSRRRNLCRLRQRVPNGRYATVCKREVLRLNP
jgi:tetratricopeptide (TPR) repeat protein